VNSESLRLEENQLKEKIALLDAEQKKRYYLLESQQVKDPDTYAALNWAFLAGFHHFYLGKWLWGLIDLSLMAFGFLLFYITDNFWIGFGVLFFVFIIELPQLLNSQNIIHQYNNQLMRNLIEQISNVRF